ncbi:MAG: DNA repair protein RecO [Chloroflexota bacterium]
MSTPRTYQTEAVIIHKIKLGEADRILTLYTSHLGKIRAVAKGVRRPRSKLAGHLELLTHSLVSLARGRNLDTITGSQTINGFLPLKSDLERTSAALYACDLIDQFTAEHAEGYHIFQLLLETLDRLCQETNRELILRYFEMHLLTGAGYRPELMRCLSCSKTLEPVVNAFSVSAGGVLCPGCRSSQFAHPLPVNVLKVLRLLQSDRYDMVCRLKMDHALSSEISTIIRSYIRYLLERDVKSAAWLDSLERTAES